jgi:hypothetical protein
MSLIGQWGFPLLRQADQDLIWDRIRTLQVALSRDPQRDVKTDDGDMRVIITRQTHNLLPGAPC